MGSQKKDGTRYSKDNKDWLAIFSKKNIPNQKVSHNSTYENDRDNNKNRIYYNSANKPNDNEYMEIDNCVRNNKRKMESGFESNRNVKSAKKQDNIEDNNHNKI